MSDNNINDKLWTVVSRDDYLAYREDNTAGTAIALHQDKSGSWHGTGVTELPHEAIARLINGDVLVVCDGEYTQLIMREL